MGPLRKIANTLIDEQIDDLTQIEEKIFLVLEDEGILTTELDDDDYEFIVLTNTAKDDWSR